jgi:hypothetical protein
VAHTHGCGSGGMCLTLRTVSIFSEKNSKLNSSTLPFLNYSNSPVSSFIVGVKKRHPLTKIKRNPFFREKIIKYPAKRELSPEKNKKKMVIIIKNRTEEDERERKGIIVIKKTAQTRRAGSLIIK